MKNTSRLLGDMMPALVKAVKRDLASLRRVLKERASRNDSGITLKREGDKFIVEKKWDIGDRREVCAHCLIEEYFFTGGGSWSPDFCPQCRGEDYVMFKDLSLRDKIRANRLFNQMWRKAHGRKHDE